MQVQICDAKVYFIDKKEDLKSAENQITMCTKCTYGAFKKSDKQTAQKLKYKQFKFRA